MDGLTRVDYPDGNYVSYRYDKFNRLTKVSTAFGDTAYQYDLLDRITRVVDRNGYATVYEYDANGNRTAVKYANGLTVSYEYDKLNRLICEETIDNDSNIVVKYVYTLGASGERLSVTELDRTVEYTYDELYRLTSETITKGKTKTTYAYEYDNVSNRTLKTVNGVETVYTYNELNQLVSEDSTIYEYDNAGNLVRVVGVGKTAIYSYNSENKLIKATVQQGNNVVVETYTYDYAGNRTSKTTTINNHVEKVYYLNDNSSLTNVLVEIGADGTEKCFYTIGADLISQEIDGKTFTYLYDGHGTVRALANENGKITDTYTYDAFGNLISSTGSTANNYRCCGEQFDSTTGLYYLRARYMDTSTGRFISQDTYAGSTADPISLHKYLYANSNPVMYSDPSGYMSLGETMVTCAVIGALGGGCITAGLNVLRFLRGDSEITSKYDSPVTAFVNGFLDGMVWGTFVGISIGVFLTLGIYAAIAVTINFGFSYYYYDLAKNSLATRDWDYAIYYMFMCICSVGMAFTAFDAYSNFQKEAEERAKTSTNNSSPNKVDTQKVIDSANNSKKGGETVAGHALQKHAGRNPDIWGKVKGGPEQINQDALKHLNDIIDAPGEFSKVQAPNGVYFLEKVLPDGRGVRLNMDGTFKGFIDQ